MVLALAGLSTTTTFFKRGRELLQTGRDRRSGGTRKVGARRPCQRGGIRTVAPDRLSPDRAQVQARAAIPPAVSSARPASDSSTSAANTSPAGAPSWRASSSTWTGVGESRSDDALDQLGRRLVRRRRRRAGRAGRGSRRIISMARSTSSAPSHSAAPWRIRSLQPAGARIERRARHRQHLAPLLGRQPRGDQRARLQLGLDHHDAPATGRRSAGCGAGSPCACARRLGALSETMQPRSAIGGVERRRSRADRCRRRRRPAPRPCRWAARPRGRPHRCRGRGRRRRPGRPRPSSAARPRAKRQPAAEATRAPTIATARRCSSAASPSAQSTGGGGSIALSAAGKPASPPQISAARRAPRPRRSRLPPRPPMGRAAASRGRPAAPAAAAPRAPAGPSR